MRLLVECLEPSDIVRPPRFEMAILHAILEFVDYFIFNYRILTSGLSIAITTASLRNSLRHGSEVRLKNTVNCRYFKATVLNLDATIDRFPREGRVRQRGDAQGGLKMFFALLYHNTIFRYRTLLASRYTVSE